MHFKRRWSTFSKENCFANSTTLRFISNKPDLNSNINAWRTVLRKRRENQRNSKSGLLFLAGWNHCVFSRSWRWLHTWRSASHCNWPGRKLRHTSSELRYNWIEKKRPCEGVKKVYCYTVDTPDAKVEQCHMLLQYVFYVAGMDWKIQRLLIYVLNALNYF